MAIEFYRVRPIEGGRIRCEVEFDSLAHFTRCANELLGVPDGVAFSHAERVSRNARQLTPEQTEAMRNQMKREAAGAAVGQALPGYGPRDFFGDPLTQPLPSYITAHVPRVLITAPDEPPLRAGGFMSADEAKVGGTD